MSKKRDTISSHWHSNNLFAKEKDIHMHIFLQRMAHLNKLRSTTFVIWIIDRQLT
jgi:hypothetical protein